MIFPYFYIIIHKSKEKHRQCVLCYVMSILKTILKKNIKCLL